MKKIINKPSDFVEESIDGLIKFHPDIYAFAPDNKRVNENLTNSKIQNYKTYVGRYATSMEMAGFSITTLKLNNNLREYLFALSECPFWNK